MRTTFSLLPLVLLSPDAWGARRPVPPPMAIRAPLMAAVPTIDGMIHEAEWTHATRGVGMVAYQKELQTPRRTVWWIGSDGKRIYAAVRSER